MKLRYELALTGPSAGQQSGCTDLPGALPLLLKQSGILAGGTGILCKDSEPQAQIRIAASADSGVYLGLTADGKVYLSLGDAEALSDCIPVGDDGQTVSRGLFLPDGTALAAIRFFAETGQPDPAVTWIAPEELPEDGSCII